MFDRMFRQTGTKTVIQVRRTVTSDIQVSHTGIEKLMLDRFVRQTGTGPATDRQVG